MVKAHLLLISVNAVPYLEQDPTKTLIPKLANVAKVLFIIHNGVCEHT